MKKKIKNIYTYLKQVFTEFAEDDILKYSASLAYYTVFSLAPVLIVIISLCGVLSGKEAIPGHIYGQIKGLVWKDVLIGGLITSVFFTLGKLTIGYYLGSSNIASVYGAAGSIMIIMVWVYYSSIILYLGAEFTKVYAKLHGGKIFPNEYAIWIKTEETQVANPVLKNKDLD